MSKSPTYIVCFLLFSLAIINACKKETSISGIIIDKSTNLPLEGVAMWLSANCNVPPPEYSKVLDFDSITTGIDGRFFLSIESKKSHYLGYIASKSGYMRKVKELGRGADLERDLEMYPIDSYLKVTAKNQIGGTDKLYYLVSGEYFEDTVMFGYPWPHELAVGDSITSVFKLPGGTNTLIYWGDANNTSTWRHDGVDSVFCARNDTTLYVLKF